MAADIAARGLVEDAPLSLQEACEVYFRGAISPASLRAEARRGHLVIMRIGRRDFVTLSAIREMMQRCRVGQRGPGSGTIPSSVSGIYETERRSAARVAALKSAEEQKERFRRTSRKNMSPRAQVIPLK